MFASLMLYHYAKPANEKLTKQQQTNKTPTKNTRKNTTPQNKQTTTTNQNTPPPTLRQRKKKKRKKEKEMSSVRAFYVVLFMISLRRCNAVAINSGHREQLEHLPKHHQAAMGPKARRDGAVFGGGSIKCRKLEVIRTIDLRTIEPSAFDTDDCRLPCPY